jgi:hypothetical protein
MRVVNVLVEPVTIGRHAQPWFMADSQYLSHGDDPYNPWTKATPPMPASEISRPSQVQTPGLRDFIGSSAW